MATPAVSATDTPATFGHKFMQASTLVVGGSLGGAALIHGLFTPAMKVQNRLIFAGVGLGLGAALYGFFR